MSLPGVSDQRFGATKVVVATSVMLSFISFWRAAAIVLNDLASTAYYIGGIAEAAIGKAAPWFILAIMLFSYAVRAVYIESCSMFVRGGVYKVVHEALGGTLAKFSVSALMFDYVLTGPISGVSAGLYLGGLLNETAELFRLNNVHIHPPYFAAAFAIAVTVYFWRKNIIGIPESSQKALRIMQVTTAMVVILIAWCLVTIATKGYSPVPAPVMANIHFRGEALGWLRGTALPAIPLIAILAGLGHSLLAMSGEESMAQVYREIAHPKLKNLEKAGFVIFLYSMLFTSLVSFFAVMIIPDTERTKFLDNLIGGLSMYLAGPESLRLLFHGFVVLVGTLILAGAINTSIIGSNGVLNRVAEDGVLPDWFRHPHRKFGTSHRIINLIALLQIATIVISRGDVYLLGEAYAFGVMWSFFMKALSVLVLRYKRPKAREWKVPLNFCIGGTEIPVGLGLITVALFLLAAINVLTKQAATISGTAFTVFFFTVFVLSEKYHGKRTSGRQTEMEKFRVEVIDSPSPDATGIRPGNVLVAVRNPHRLDHLRKVLEKTDTRKMDIVALSVRLVNTAGAGEYGLEPQQIFGDTETLLFTKVVNLAEKAGKPVSLLAIPGTDPNLAVVQIAQRLQSSRIVAGTSGARSVDEQAHALGLAWELLPEPRPAVSFEIVLPQGESAYYNLGPHPPRLWPDDVELVHRLWVELSREQIGAKLHHRDVVRAALRRFEQELNSPAAPQLIEELRSEVEGRPSVT
ncbi:MAG: APC family permease [Bryobacteraceae bacterium]